MKLVCLITTLGLLPAIGAGQELPVNTKQQLENLSEAIEEEPEDDGLLQMLYYWQKRPLNLNSADADDLKLFPFLTPLHIENFLQYRKLLGGLIDLHELQSIPSWNLDIIRQILPYVQVQLKAQPFKTFAARLNGGEHQLLLRSSRVLQRSQGFRNENNNGFVGDPYHPLLRYQFRNPDGLQWGFTAEKDAGEPLFKKHFPAPDFLSAHVFLRKMGKIKALALGDFTVNMGQGLVQWQALAFGKGPATMNIKRQSPVLRPYAAAGEANYLRGAGATLNFGGLEATVFAATQRINAGMDLNEHGKQVITSFDVGGLHRTASELAKRKAAGQQVIGGVLQFQKGGFYFGLNAVHYQFSSPVEKRNEPYNQFALKSSNSFNYSADYSFTWHNLHLFGELAADRRGRPALVQGILLSVHPKLDLALHGRMLHQGYTVVAANAFTENTLPQNEQGIYAGLQLKAHPKVTLNAYGDMFRFPWLRFRVHAPSGGCEYLLQAMYQPAKGAEIYARFRARNKAVNQLPESGNMAFPQPYAQKNLRLHVGQSHGKWALRSRAEMVWLNPQANQKETGFLWYGEAQYHGIKRLEVTARLSLFETGGYNSRVYAFESDVLYGYSIPPLFGKGMRCYIMLHGRLSKEVSVWTRVAHNIYPDQQSIGSGLGKIEGNQRTEVKCQMLIRF